MEGDTTLYCSQDMADRHEVAAKNGKGMMLRMQPKDLALSRDIVKKYATANPLKQSQKVKVVKKKKVVKTPGGLAYRWMVNFQRNLRSAKPGTSPAGRMPQRFSRVVSLHTIWQTDSETST